MQIMDEVWDMEIEASTAGEPAGGAGRRDVRGTAAGLYPRVLEDASARCLRGSRRRIVPISSRARSSILAYT